MGLRRALAAVPVGVWRWLPYWLLSAAVFLVGAALGGAIGAERSTAVVFPVRESGAPLPDVSAVGLFVHNAVVSAKLVAGGVVAGVPTLYLLLFNGFAFGSVVVDAAAEFGLLTTLALVAPHGLVELPALWLAGAVPARWLHVVWLVASGRDRRTPIPRILLRTVVALVVVTLLLAVAAVIEATITVALARVL